MKKRIFAFLCLVVVLVPLLVLPIAADETDASAADGNVEDEGLVEITEEEYNELVEEEQAQVLDIDTSGATLYDGVTGYTLQSNEGINSDVWLDDYVRMNLLNTSGYGYRTLKYFDQYFHRIPDVYYDNYGDTKGYQCGTKLYLDPDYYTVTEAEKLDQGRGIYSFAIYRIDQDTGATYTSFGDISIEFEVIDGARYLSVIFKIDQSMHMDFVNPNVEYYKLLYVSDTLTNKICNAGDYKGHIVDEYRFVGLYVENGGIVYHFDTDNWRIAVGIAFESKETFGNSYLMNKLLAPSVQNGEDTFKHWYFPKTYCNAYDTAFVKGYNDGESVGYLDGYNEGYTEGDEDGYVAGLYLGKQQGYEKGYAEGDALGYDRGYSHGKQDGYQTGYSAGTDDGYANGVSNTIEEVDLINILKVILEAPFYLFSTLFGFEILGINVSGFIFGLLGVILAVWVISKLSHR